MVQIDEGNRAFAGTEWEGKWWIYHDPLKQFYEAGSIPGHDLTRLDHDPEPRCRLLGIQSLIIAGRK